MLQGVSVKRRFPVTRRRLTQTPYYQVRFGVLDCVLGTVEPLSYKDKYNG
jgi:hypothetical protein